MRPVVAIAFASILLAATSLPIARSHTISCEIAATGAASPSDPTSAPASAPATNPAADLPFQQLVARLADPDYAVRSKAQKELDAIGPDQRPVLVKLADAATDPEAHARLQSRITEIDDQLATNPPPISLDLHDASFADMIDALKKATGASIQQWPERSFPMNACAFTIHAVNQPFWNVFTELSHQYPLTLQPGWNERFKIMGMQSPGLQRGAITGGFAAFPQTLTRSINLQTVTDGPAPAAQMTLSYFVAADPRIKVLASQITLTDACDDAGNILLHAARPGSRNLNAQMARSNCWSASESWRVPDHLGKKISAAKGLIRACISVSESTAELAKPADNTSVTIGNRTLKISRWQPRNNGIIEYQMGLEQPGGPRANPWNAIANGLGDPLLRVAENQVDISVVDSTNQVVFQFAGGQGWGGSIGVQGVPPLKIRVSLPSRTKIVEIPFELKDIPLP